MRILFVDDEPAVLDGISRSLFHLADEWEIETATGGQEALELLQEEPFDVLVTDMRMPGMDGAQLLTLVQEGHPDTVRIVLSGHTELEAAMRVAPVAHQFLTKPCSADQIEAVVERACRLRELLTDETVRAAVGQVQALPPVPRLYTRLTQMLEDPDVGVAEVTELIQSDPALCAKTLQLVNSSFFTIGRQITSAHEAVSRLGIRMVKNLALLTEVFGPAHAGSVDQSVLEDQAKHGLAVGTLASRFFGKQKAMAESAFLAGILHDVGKLVLFQRDADWVQRVTSHAQTEQIGEVEAEEAVLAARHDSVGGYLLGVWGLPHAVTEAVAFHHAPPEPLSLDLATAVHIANELLEGRTPAAAFFDLLGTGDDVRARWQAEADRIRAGTEGAP